MYVHNHGAVPQFFVDLMNGFTKALPYESGPSHFSATGLLRGPLEAALARKYPDVEKDALEGIAAIDGTMLHRGLELAAQHMKGAIAERRLFRKFNVDGTDYVLSAANDLYLPNAEDGRILIDWKRIKAKSVFYMRKPSSTNLYYEGQYHKSDWVWQLNTNRLLIESAESYYFDLSMEDLKGAFYADHGRPMLEEDYCSKWMSDYAQPHLAQGVDRMFIGAFFKDWAPWEAKRSPDYPQAPVAFIEIPRFPDEVVSNHLRGRMRYHLKHRDAPVDSIPLCDDRERMKGDTVYKVFDMTSKAKNPRSKGNFADEASASNLAELEENRTGKEHRVVEVPGIDAKCAGFCDFRHLCRHGQEVAQASVWEVDSDE